ncbi:MAG: hypothetical protein C0609_11380 [Deltaproteobacteria bacterium]|nr:MAG: hypothetical protein C0609_11380 [Deltaproteobacteria bacterium]
MTRPPSFDPYGLMARLIGERQSARVVRWALVCLAAGFLAIRASEYGDFISKPLWAAETLIFLVMLLAFLLRAEPVERSRGVKMIIIPIIGGLLPFALLMTPPDAALLKDPSRREIVFWAMTIFTSLTVWGLWALRRAFSITVEARVVVSGGPYLFIRHPVYLGELLTAGTVLFIRPSKVNLLIYTIFLAVQLFRSRLEETVLMRNFPDYKEKMGGRFWFWRV